MKIKDRVIRFAHNRLQSTIDSDTDKHPKGTSENKHT